METGDLPVWAQNALTAAIFLGTLLATSWGYLKKKITDGEPKGTQQVIAGAIADSSAIMALVAALNSQEHCTERLIALVQHLIIHMEREEAVRFAVAAERAKHGG